MMTTTTTNDDDVDGDEKDDDSEDDAYKDEDDKLTIDDGDDDDDEAIDNYFLAQVDTPVMVVVSISFNDQNFHLVEQDRFTFYQNPILVLLYPAGGPNVGGTSVTIFGQGLQSFGIGRMYCSFGTNVVRTTTNSSTQDQIVCSSPHSPSSGIALVSVSLNGQDFTGALFFDYYMLPALSALSPMGGPPIRDPQLYTSVTISGSGFSSFHGSALCRFDRRRWRRR
eukprot:767243-Hanusia_phi.AAC.9